MKNMTLETLELNDLLLDDDILNIIADTQTCNDVNVSLETIVISNNIEEAEID